MKRTTKHFTFAFVFLFLVGCTDSNTLVPAKVSGRISYNGKPLKGGHLQFVTADGTAYPGSIDSDGTYSGIDLPIGEMVVTVDTEVIKPAVSSGKTADRYTAMQGGQKAPAGSGPTAPKFEEVYIKIPTSYNNAKTSKLTITLAKGRQVKDLELKD